MMQAQQDEGASGSVHDTPLGAATLAFADLADQWMATVSRARLHLQAGFARAARGLPPIAPVHGPASPHRVALETPLLRLLHYPASGEPRQRTPIVIVASLINRYYVLDLLPELSVIGGLQRRGFDVWVLDWQAPGARGHRLGFADYVDGAIADCVAHAASVAKVDRVALIGYCMGGTLAAIFAALHPQRLKALALLGTPIDFHASGRLAEWTSRELFDADLLIDALGNMPPALLQSGFKLMRPLDALAKVVRMHLEPDEARLRHMVALEAWLDDNVAFPGGVYREYIGQLYQANALARGKFKVGGRAVDLRRLKAPLLNVIALRDHICEPPSSRALMPLVGAKDRRLLEFDTGHIGLTTSRRSHEQLWPQIADWLVERCR